MIHAATFLLSLAGFALLLLAMARHQQDWLRRKLPASRSRAQRLSGFLMLALAFVMAGSGLGWGYGAAVWFGWMTAAAALIVAANLNRDRVLSWVRP